MSGETPKPIDRRRLAQVIRACSPEIEKRWVARVAEGLQVSHLDPTALRDGIRDYLELLADALGDEEHSAELEGLGAWREVAGEHGVTRVRLGFDIGQLIHEFTLLRRVITEVTQEQGLVDHALSEFIADLIGAAVEAAVGSYVDSRDYQSRKAEAQHIGFLTHELRNPLSTAMMANSQIMKAQNLPPAVTRSAETAARSLERLKKLIDDVLDVEQFEGGDRKPQPIDTSLSEILNVATDRAREEASAKGLRLEIRGPQNLPLRVDPQLATAVVQNLVDNAVKYTDFGTIEIEVEERSDSILINVRDNCGGISNEELAVIFEPFRRGAAQHSKPGSGLGLAIAKRAAEAQGGSLGGASRTERGCHFWFVLPKRVADVEREEAEASDSP